MLNFKFYGTSIVRSYFKLGLSNFSSIYNKNFSSSSSMIMRCNILNFDMSVQMPILKDNIQNDNTNIGDKIENTKIITNLDDDENITVDLKGRNSKAPKRVNNTF